LVDQDVALLEPKFDPEFVAELIYYIIQHFKPSKKRDEDEDEVQGNNKPMADGKGEAILVFLSGIQQMEKVQKAIKSNKSIQKIFAKLQIYLLHSSLPPEQQRRVFKTTLPGQWKIILSTNIAETSVTIDDITHVIDCGFMKEQRFNPISQISILQEIFISRANARQRAGRAGRIKSGDCWRIFDEKYFQTSPQILEFSLPEIKRISLEEIILMILFLNLGKPETFLSCCLEPPSRQQISSAVATLIEIKAIYPKANLPLTPLGFHLAKMPVDVRVGKMLIYSCLLEVRELFLDY
jgi:ATP-dependent RNA helicase DHX29